MKSMTWIALLLAAASGAYAQSKWAFVVGIDDYADQPLNFAVADAQRIQRALSESGFKVTWSENRSLDALQRQWETFLALIQKGDIAVVYFAGHGQQRDGKNYLLARDFNETSSRDKTVRADQWIADLNRRQPALKIIVLDACRSEPSSGAPAGLASMENPDFGQGTYIVFATAPGRVAKEQLFATTLAREMLRPGQLLPQVFSATAAAVEKGSNGAQSPFAISSGSIPEFYFSNPRRDLPLQQVRDGKCEEALPTLRTLSRLEANDGQIWMALANCQTRAGDFATARQSLDRARTLIDRPHEVDTILARLAFEEGDTFEAKQRISDALLEQPNFAEALLLRAHILIKEEKYRDAVDVLESLYRDTQTHESCELFAQALRLDGATRAADVQAARCTAR